MIVLSKILFGKNELLDFNKIIEKKFRTCKLFVLVDENTSKHCLPVLKSNLPAAKLIVIKSRAGEKYKNLELCNKIWKAFNKNNADRNSLLINLGGGVICDAGGFAASVFKRGISFINIPTSLLAMTDAAIGGKTGIDFKNYKNQIGTFTQPVAIVVYPPFLKTLPAKEINNGKAEIIKHALIADKHLWKQINSNFSITDALLKKSIAVKTSIVKKDFYENGCRKLLNFGHTIGHAIESYFLSTRKNILHGETVAAGMICEAYLSHTTGLLTWKELISICEFIKPQYVHIEIPEVQKIKQFLFADKKNANGKINFTLLEAVGKGKINFYCTIDEITESLSFYHGFYAIH